MIELELKEMFSAAHALKNYPGVCRRIHGHNWTVKVRLKTEGLDENGMSVDVTIIRARLLEVLNRLDHQLINDLPAFQEINPTSELIAQYIFHEFQSILPEGLQLQWIKLSETDGFSVIYSPS